MLQKSEMTIATICLIACVGSAATWYVDASRPDDNGPGTSLASAWQVIQTGVDNASSNDVVLVAPGVYTEGGAYFNGTSNRADINKAILVKAISTNHADTVIVGGPDPGTAGRGPNATRGVYLRNAGAISGFTITNGYAGNAWNTQWGGGICMLGTNTTASNCVIVGNCSDYGAVSPNTSSPGGNLYNSILRNNVGGAGARSRDSADQLRLINCQLIDNSKGGEEVTMVNCRITGNGSIAAQSCVMVNCLVARQTGKYVWGTVWGGTAVNCTITRNDTCDHQAYGNVTKVDLYNCIVWGNLLGVKTNYNNISSDQITMCTCMGTNFDGGVYFGPTNLFKEAAQGINGNTVEDPLFNDPESDFTLDRRLSPCIDAGDNSYILSVISNYPQAAFDLDGNPRIDTIKGIVDMGAYEYEPPPAGTVLTFF